MTSEIVICLAIPARADRRAHCRWSIRSAVP
jgi:hypothetical protein